MIVRLFCPQCALAEKDNLPHATIDVPMPIARLSDDGRYKVRCELKHVSTVCLDNVKFELLFEMGLNALVDGYPREAVSSFAAALERFYEFYWYVAMTHTEIPEREMRVAWKVAAKQSERQLGMFITAHLLLMKAAPEMLNPNKEVRLRNDVIHGGYMPTSEEGIAFGDTVMTLINQELSSLRQTVPQALETTYAALSPARRNQEGESESDGIVNLLTAVDVRHPAEGTDLRVGGVADQFKRILRDREPHRLELFSEEELRKQYPKAPKNLQL